MSNMFGDLFGGRPYPGAEPSKKTPEKAPIWEAKEIDGKLYVSLEQVAELLSMNDVLPDVLRGLKRRL